MQLKQIDNLERGSRIYNLEITDDDLRLVNLLKVDELLIEECEKSEKISDKLLALETIARRIEEKTN